MPVDAKIEILRSIGDWKKDYAGKPATKEMAKAIENRLASCLDERDEDQQLSRICDVAAFGLSKQWNLPKLFDPQVGPAARNRAVLLVKNVWLKSHGRKQVVVPVPAKKTIEAKEVEPLLATIIAAPMSDDAKKAIARIEVLGLPSLVHLRNQIKDLNEDHPARKSLEIIASRNACTISAVRFSDDSLAKPAEMMKIAESLNGKPLSADSYVETVLAISKFIPANVGGLCLAVDRDGDDTGMVLELRVLPRNDPKPGESLHLRREEIVRVAGNHFHHSMGASAGIGSDDSTPMAWSRQDFDRFAKQLKAALESPSEAQLQVRITIVRGR